MSYRSFLIEGDTITLKDGEIYKYLFPTGKKKFCGVSSSGYRIVGISYSDIENVHHIQRSKKEELEYRVKVALMELGNRARLEGSADIIEAALLDFEDFGYYKVVYEGDREVFKDRKLYPSIRHYKIDENAQVVFAVKGYYL